MPDFGILTTMRNMLQQNSSAKLDEFKDRIHFAIPSSAIFPMVLLELEEIWTSLRYGEASNGHTKIKLKASVYSKKSTGRESLKMADYIRQIFDGTVLNLDEGKSGTLRLSTSIIDMPTTERPRSVQQFYEVMIRG